MPDHTETIVALLQRIEGHLGILSQRFRPAAPLTDRAEMLELLAATHEAVGERLFTSRDLMKHAEVTRAWRLLTAIGNVVGASGSPPQKLGKALRRYEGAALGGLVVQRIGKDRGVALWKVCATS